MYESNLKVSFPRWKKSKIKFYLFSSGAKGHQIPEHHKVFLSPWIFAAAAKSLQSCPTLCDPVDGSPPGSPVPEILQARTLQWVAISSSNAWKWNHSVVSYYSRPMDCSLPGSSVHGIFQARVLESPPYFPKKLDRHLPVWNWKLNNFLFYVISYWLVL